MGADVVKQFVILAGQAEPDVGFGADFLDFGVFQEMVVFLFQQHVVNPGRLPQFADDLADGFIGVYLG
jgi:hypothetical protein